jgi:AcrR family transcriptional regulator
MAVRLTRTERKEQTRADLIAAARAVFLRRGFHGASLDEIAVEAGYTKGAVYSNFAGKDDLFVAVLDAHYESRLEVYAELMLDGETFDETARTVSRFMADAGAREPGWLPTLAEFVAHAARDEPLRAEYVRVRERFLVAVAAIIANLAERHGVALRVSPLEAARASSALVRGFSAERQLDPDGVSSDLFVELHAALMRGLAAPEERSQR